MKRYLLAIVCVGCWGEGPTPTLPDGVDLILSLPSNTDSRDCSDVERYIGDVAIGDGYLHAALLNAAPPSCSGMMLPQYVAVVRHVPLDGAAELDDDMAGNSKGVATVRVAATTSHRAFVSSQGDMITFLDFDATPTLHATLDFTGIGGFYVPTGFVADDTHAYVVATASGAPLDFNSPIYPCCGTFGGGSLPMSKGWSVDWNAPSPGQVMADAVYNNTLKHGLVANATTLFYASRTSSGDPIKIKVMPKAATMTTGVPGTTLAQADVLTGLAANDTAVVWTTTDSFEGSSPRPTCKVWLQQLPSNAWAPTLLFTTNDFSCVDAEIDDTHVYFTIVSVHPNDTMSGPGSNYMRGIGLARVSVLGGVLDSIRHGIDSDFVGPRRVYLDGDNMYAVDPFTVVRIAKSAFDGKHDF